ncbi:MAG TPA: hypothetical protein VK116_13325, partial [Planctomycetota bacterium]|nr:hypothetical protein [Planctomycetota bacterium]
MTLNRLSMKRSRWPIFEARAVWLLACAMSVFAVVMPARAAEREEDYYRILTYPTPDGVQFEPGALTITPSGELAIATRIGEIWIASNAFTDDPRDIEYKLFASGLHEPLGLTTRDGVLWATQRGEVTKIIDLDGDGLADRFETVSDDWGLTSDYHEYAFGSPFDRDGNIWIVLCLTGSFTSQAPFRGWCVRVSADGTFQPTAGGVRSPGGIGFNHEGEAFYTDNQGPWNGACSLKHLRPGFFVGHPIGNRWYSLTDLDQPATPKSGSRTHVEADRIPEYVPPAVIFPYNKMGQSASGIVCDETEGRFGPFSKQLFVSDQTQSVVMRVFLEKVDGRYQGACFPFRKGFRSGNVPMVFAPDGSLVVGGTQRGWGSRGGREFALERLVWTGKTPFEIEEMRALPDGFELTFTTELQPESAAKIESYRIGTYTYIFQESYGSPEVDATKPTIRALRVADDRRSVRLDVDGLMRGHVHELHLEGVRASDGRPLLHPVAY